jgi:hypothetical protein
MTTILNIYKYYFIIALSGTQMSTKCSSVATQARPETCDVATECHLVPAPPLLTSQPQASMTEPCDMDSESEEELDSDSDADDPEWLPDYDIQYVLNSIQLQLLLAYSNFSIAIE